MEQEKELKQEQKKQKKSNKLSNFLFVLLLIGLGVGYFFYMKGMVKPVVSINGTEVTVDMTVQELVSKGFSVGDSISGKGDMNLSAQPQIPGESYTSTFYYVYKNGEYTNVVFHVYNAGVNSVNLPDSKIYEFRYNPSDKSAKTSVLINGIDFSGLDKAESVAALEELGIKFKASDKDEFISGDKNIIFGDSGNYSYMLETDTEGNTVRNIEVKRKV